MHGDAQVAVVILAFSRRHATLERAGETDTHASDHVSHLPRSGQQWPVVSAEDPESGITVAALARLNCVLTGVSRVAERSCPRWPVDGAASCS